MMSKASEASERDQTEIIQIVVERIQGKLIKPPENCNVPNTIAWISVVTKCRYVLHRIKRMGQDQLIF